MDMTRNIIPEAVRSIHLIAICGTGMGALAVLLRDMGYAVTGSDQNVYPPMSTFLEEKGIRLFHGFSPENLSHRPDLVIVGNAVTKDNPESVGVMETGLSFCSMPQAINRFLAKGKKRLVVTGTHGKTTTASMLAWVLTSCGLDPSFLIGGILKNFQSSARVGSGPHIVLEGDEYDTAFFDKGPKFLHYQPDVAIMTSIEFDHADIFRDLDHIREAFHALVSGMGPDKVLVAWDGDQAIDEVIRDARANVVRYAENGNCQWRLGNDTLEPPWSLFEVLKDGDLFGEFRVRMPGAHNLLNALSVVAAADELGISADVLAKAFETFEGVRRRQEVRGIRRGITVIDDFAHHPTAVRETIRALRPFYPDGRLIAVFEPRTNSSMRNIFQTEYAASFAQADIVCIRKPPLLHKVPEGERFSSQQLVDDLKQQAIDAHYFSDTEAIIDFLTAEARSGDLILVMSNGGFDNIHERLLDIL
ncbi:UDP-N-acetylmuramate:L-alanyl-gamma-D-glutamyl-meso-diaminopimelate ligase (EC [Olavius algarvensis associated proteobacterium Delta 3]|nr:UDP-N-acetylmuramate:L-alanyl-gamma-D-glutamyl-meso-diaminopimelate ligase (EC [Olavius algarvensis associated proteobacterium Delta 3]CAB5084566.1 UDP-N-acetylmuramate:L-alanyl-gamma-D-glutamyl-meso-diaminopimelate ligase (EC [Olavius algarvensis associated proteobacterium Delta 3]